MFECTECLFLHAKGWESWKGQKLEAWVVLYEEYVYILYIRFMSWLGSHIEEEAGSSCLGSSDLDYVFWEGTIFMFQHKKKETEKKKKKRI